MRILATVWLRCDPWFAEHLPLATGSISILGYEPRHTVPALMLWNYQPKKRVRRKASSRPSRESGHALEPG
jgi:hypothetical protein